MARYPQFIDNTRKSMSDVLNDIAPSYDQLSIATGYWDLAGTLRIIDQLENYSQIRLLIGKEPIAHRYQKKFNIDLNDPDHVFPDADIKNDLENYSNSENYNDLRKTLLKLVALIENKQLQVKIYRDPRLHAKAYIFGALGAGDSVGIIGSSNFTEAGLTSNSELNFLTDDYKIVEFEPQTAKQENGHHTWFNELWNSEEAIEWTGDFIEILRDSPLGDFTYGPFDVYMRTLMELFPDELIEVDPFSDEIEAILHPFQNQNALSLRRKLESLGIAMLSDSVGLGKTITAAAIIKQYLEEGKRNIVILPPASLKRQWIDELQGERWNLVEGRDFRIISQQDGRTIDELLRFSKKQKYTSNEVDLFIVDEAHNLRNQGNTRHQQVLELFQENPNSRVLMLTATPINNSLMDFANQIQLGLKGDLVSRNVPYQSKKSGSLEYIDFFEALKRIQSEATRAERRGEVFDWEHNKNTLVTGIRHYLVRSTRQGVLKRNAMKAIGDQKFFFPKAKVEQFSYKYHDSDNHFIKEQIAQKVPTLFEGIDVSQIDLELVGEITQRTAHPLDIFQEALDNQTEGNFSWLVEKWAVHESYEGRPLYKVQGAKETIIPLIFKIINVLGFTPYRPDSYLHTIYNKSVSEIRALNIKGKEANRFRIQLSIHNMLHVTWLKRLESSTATLLKSVDNYLDRVALFEKWLNQGYIVSLTDASLLAKEYAEDIERAFEDYESYMQELDESIQSGSLTEVKRKGIERRIASEVDYNLKQLRIDIERDKEICSFLKSLLEVLSQAEHDEKLKTFAHNIGQRIKSEEYGKKVIVFSFFSDTINYLRDSLPDMMEAIIPGFSKQAEFVSGDMSTVENIARRFSPRSKNYDLEKGETEINYLFATDVLSEGQNLQDAGILVNYDLHWNPVRMIQRNGRINRLGSVFGEILIANARPHDDLELYLNLVRRLERKISTINNTVGNDQSVLGEVENPIEFTDTYYTTSIFDEDPEKAKKALDELEGQSDLLDWVDSYSLELRNFIDMNKETGEVSRLLKMPNGKWNYLPRKHDTDLFLTTQNEVFGLYRTQGQFAHTGEKIRDVGFVKIDKEAKARGPFSQVRASYVQEQDVLKLIKTTPDDNRRQVDRIKVDRRQYIEKGKTEISVQFESESSVYSILPSGKKALEILSEYFDDNLLRIISNGVRRSNEKREFERIVREINREVREHGSPFTTTVRRFENLLKTLLQYELMEKQLDKVEGVLFYAKQEQIEQD